MSRTDKTRPFWVKEQEYATPRHDHRNGYCDLPEKSNDKRDRFLSRADRRRYPKCDWYPSGSVFYDVYKYRCSCCRDWDSLGKTKRARAKRQWKNWEKEYE
jgi:uncharacterized Fe-S radical SAM superfamily protein PflX